MNTSSTSVVTTRRGFLGTVFSSGALILGSRIATPLAFAQAAPTDLWQPNVWVGLEPDGNIIIVASRSDMGTGIRTALPMVLAEELEADWNKVRVVQAIGDKKYGSQETDGSVSMRNFYTPMQEAGATARMMLEAAAAAMWGVPKEQCAGLNHEVVHAPSGRKAGYGSLVAAAAKLTAPKPADLRFKPAVEYRYIGKGVQSIDLRNICTGKAQFGIDVTLPGMLYASVERSPVFGGTLKTVDNTEALKTPGVLETIQIDAFKPPCAYQALGGVAVLATNTWAAAQGRKKLKIEWTDGPNATYDSVAYRAALEETSKKPGKLIRNEGNVDTVFQAGGKTLEASYYAPHLAHASMEPPSAVAEFKDGKVTVWACTQDPQAAQDTVAEALGIKPGDVTCNVTLLGGGFGRKTKQDFVAEAAILAKKTGKPVKVTWTREDDIRFDYFHSVAAMYMKAAVDAKGRPTAWLQRSVFPSKSALFTIDQKYGDNEEMGMGWIDLPFDIGNIRIENGEAVAHVRVGWLRSVANVYHAFAVQSFVDELAAAANRDRIEFLLDLIGPARKMDFRPENRRNRPDPYQPDSARLRRVLEVAAEKSEWAKKKSGAGHGFGVAVHRSFSSYVAAVVEVQVDKKGALSIPRIDVVGDVGRVVHPAKVVAQFEGAAIFGTSLALMGEITAANGRIVQSNFHDYNVARIQEAPRDIRVTMVPSDAHPTGVGEPGVPPIAPALCNAIFAATGKRIRALPINKTKLV